MAKVDTSVFVNAPLEKVFTFMAEPVNLLEIWPSLIEISNVTPLPNGGFSYGWTYKLAGLHFHGRAEWTEFVKDQRIVVINQSGIPSVFSWIFTADGLGTRVSLSAEYTIPGAALCRLAEPVIQKMNDKEAELFLANLKIHMEAEAGGVSSVKSAQAIT